MPEKLLGILVTHGSLGKELLRTAETILGPQDRVEVVTNAGTSLESLSESVRALVAIDRERPVFLFVDLLGGSCGHACQEVRRMHPNTIGFTGVNLPMLLEFFYHRERVPVEELIQRLLAKGRDGIQCLR